MSNFNQNVEFAGLGTFNYQAIVAGSVSFSGKIQRPRSLETGLESELLVTISQNGTPFYIGIAGADGFNTSMVACAINDLFAIVLTSSAPIDQPPNLIKTSISIDQEG